MRRQTVWYWGACAAILLGFVLLAQCGRKEPLTPETVREFMGMSVPAAATVTDCQRFYEQRIMPFIRERHPGLLALQQSIPPGQGFSPARARNLLRCALAAEAVSADSRDRAKETVAFLMPAIMEFDPAQTKFQGLADGFSDAGAYRKEACRTVAGMCLALLDYVARTRANSPGAAERAAHEALFLCLALPTEKSPLANVQGLLINSLARNVQEIRLDETMDILKGAFPEYFL